MTNSSPNGSKMANLDVNELRERLAELEHEQWIAWSKSVAETERLSPERLASWAKGWVRYSALSEADKDLDRVYADRVLATLAQLGVIADSLESGTQP